MINVDREKQIEGLLTKHGAKMLLLARFLIGLRSPFYFAAGVLRANYLRFLITDIICALLVVSLFFGLTFFYGRQIWAGIRHVEVAITIAVVLAIVVGIVVFLAHRRGKELLRQENNDEEQVAIPGDSKPAETSASNELRTPGQGA
jgi:membrane protein DedA with SNARE-associated domain